MSDIVNPLYQPWLLSSYSHNPRIAWQLEQERVRMKECHRASVQAGLGNLSLIRNPLRRPPDFEERPMLSSSSSPPPPPHMSIVDGPRRVPAQPFPNRPPPAYPSSAYTTPSYPSYSSSSYLSPSYSYPSYSYPSYAYPSYPYASCAYPSYRAYPSYAYPISAYPRPACPPPAYVTPAYAASAPAPATPAHTAPAHSAPAPATPACPPPVGPYIRPAIEEDAEEIVQILNYYTSIIPFDPEYEMMEPDHICNFIETCKMRKLPFLVLVKPPDPSQTSQESRKAQICGLTYIDFLKDEEANENVLGDLRVYVRPGMTRCGYGTLLIDCILSISDVHYRRRFQFEWRPVGNVQLQVQRLKQLVCAIAYPAQLERNYLFIKQWLKNTFCFLDFGEVRQDRAKYGYEESYCCVHLFINAGRRERLVRVPRRYRRARQWYERQWHESQ